MTNRADRRREKAAEKKKAKPSDDPRFGPRHPDAIGDGVQAEQFAPLNAVMEGLEQIFPNKSITLLVAEYQSEEDIMLGRERRLNYISNSERTTMIAVMQEFIRRSEGQVFSTPNTRQ